MPLTNRWPWTVSAACRCSPASSSPAASPRPRATRSCRSRRSASRSPSWKARLGAQLLQRTTRRLSVTDAGLAFYARAKRILAELDDAEASAADLHGSPRGTLRVGAPVAFGRLHVMPTLPAFLHRHPGLVVDLVMSDRFTDLVEDGADVVIPDRQAVGHEPGRQAPRPQPPRGRGVARLSRRTRRTAHGAGPDPVRVYRPIRCSRPGTNGASPGLPGQRRSGCRGRSGRTTPT